jgi:hypothetical protein
MGIAQLLATYSLHRCRRRRAGVRILLYQSSELIGRYRGVKAMPGRNRQRVLALDCPQRVASALLRVPAAQAEGSG